MLWGGKLSHGPLIARIRALGALPCICSHTIHSYYAIQISNGLLNQWYLNGFNGILSYQAIDMTQSIQWAFESMVYPMVYHLIQWDLIILCNSIGF